MKNVKWRIVWRDVLDRRSSKVNIRLVCLVSTQPIAEHVGFGIDPSEFARCRANDYGFDPRSVFGELRGDRPLHAVIFIRRSKHRRQVSASGVSVDADSIDINLVSPGVLLHPTKCMFTIVNLSRKTMLGRMTIVDSHHHISVLGKSPGMPEESKFCPRSPRPSMDRQHRRKRSFAIRNVDVAFEFVARCFLKDDCALFIKRVFAGVLSRLLWHFLCGFVQLTLRKRR